MVVPVLQQQVACLVSTPSWVTLLSLLWPTPMEPQQNLHNRTKQHWTTHRKFFLKKMPSCWIENTFLPQGSSAAWDCLHRFGPPRGAAFPALHTYRSPPSKDPPSRSCSSGPQPLRRLQAIGFRFCWGSTKTQVWCGSKKSKQRKAPAWQDLETKMTV